MPAAAGALRAPEAESAIPPSSRASIDAAVDTLRSRKVAWASLPLLEKIDLLRRTRKTFAAVAEAWVAACQRAEDIPGDSPRGSEEWIAGPYFVLRNLRLLQESLTSLSVHGAPRIPGPVRQRPDGRTTAAGLPRRPLRPPLLPRRHRRGVDAARRDAGDARPPPGRRLPRGAAARQGGAGAVGRQRLVDRADGRALQAVRRQRGGGVQDEPRQRLPRAAARARPAAAGRGRLPARRLRRRRGGRLPLRAPAGRQHPHHRLGQDLRRHRLRHRRRGSAAQGGGASRVSTSRSPPSSATSAR